MKLRGTSLRGRVALLCTFCIVLTMAFTLIVQSIYFERYLEEFNPAMREAMQTIARSNLSSLSGEARYNLLQNALEQTVASEQETRQFATNLSTIRSTQRRIPRFAALLSLPIALLASFVGSGLIVQPIKRVSTAAAQLAGGDLSARAVLPQFPPNANELVSLTQNFNMMAQTLERLEHERQNMVTDIAHELRTPLTILQGQIDAMREGIRPTNDASLARLDRQTQLLARLVQDLRTLSLAEAGRLSLDLRVLDIVRFAEQVTASFGEKAVERSIYLSFVPAVKEEVKVEADPDRLEQILSNLVSNALRHTPEGGSVAVAVQRYGAQVRLSVTDTGLGLSDDALTYVFDRFYRAEKYAQGTTKGVGNSGLGLSIAKALVELHGGSVGAANTAQRGAVFHVSLPITS